MLSPTQFRRPVYAGNALASVETSDAIRFITFRPTNFEEVVNTAGTPPPVVNINFTPRNSLIKHVRDEFQQSDRPELTSAKIVVAGGRGMQSKENFQLLEDLAVTLG